MLDCRNFILILLGDCIMHQMTNQKFMVDHYHF